MLEIIAKITDLGPISEDRKQNIVLSEVAIMSGDYCEGERRHIIFLNAEESKKFNIFKKTLI